MKLKKIVSTVLATTMIMAMFTGCGAKKDSTQGNNENNKTEANKTEGNERKVFTVGTTSLFEKVLIAAKEDFEKSGCKLEIKVFDDTVAPNVAVTEGSIDATFHQNGPFLTKYNKEHETKIKAYGDGLVKTFFGLYSKNIKSLDELKDNAKIAIPNEGSNMARALKLLESEGLIKIKEGVQSPTKLDIIENPKNIEIMEMGGWNVIEALPDVDAGVTSSSVALKAKLDPKSAIAVYDNEKEDYSIILAIDEKHADEKYVKLLRDVICTDKVKEAIEKDYNGGLKPLF